MRTAGHMRGAAFLRVCEGVAAAGRRLRRLIGKGNDRFGTSRFAIEVFISVALWRWVFEYVSGITGYEL